MRTETKIFLLVNLLHLWTAFNLADATEHTWSNWLPSLFAMCYNLGAWITGANRNSVYWRDKVKARAELNAQRQMFKELAGQLQWFMRNAQKVNFRKGKLQNRYERLLEEAKLLRSSNDHLSVKSGIAENKLKVLADIHREKMAEFIEKHNVPTPSLEPANVSQDVVPARMIKVLQGMIQTRDTLLEATSGTLQKWFSFAHTDGKNAPPALVDDTQKLIEHHDKMVKEREKAIEEFGELAIDPLARQVETNQPV